MFAYRDKKRRTEDSHDLMPFIGLFACICVIITVLIVLWYIRRQKEQRRRRELAATEMESVPQSERQVPDSS